LTEVEKRIWSDIAWAQQNRELQHQCAGEWVAIHERRVVAHGKDRHQVECQAALALQRPVEELAVWPISDDASILSDSPSQGPEC
jgi:hypothetical protein